MTNYIAIRCGRCGKEVKRLAHSMIVHSGNPSYCGDCNKAVQNLPN